jgi:ABC-2 type transporter.
MGLFVVIAVNIPLVLFSGFFIRFKDIAGYLGWIKHISFYRYAFESVMLIVYKDRARLQCSDSYCYFRNPSKLLEEFGMENAATETGFIGLSVWIIILQIMFYFILKWKIYITR